MQSKSVVIRVQTLDGQWEALGADRNRGVWPEDDSYSADHWGSSKASFNLRRDTGAMWPDLAAFTPVEVEVGGLLVWSGRVKETPTSVSSRVINVQCEGWQFHLDDDSYERAYVHAKTSDYRDMRGVPGAALGVAALGVAGQVTADGNQLYLGWAQGAVLAAGSMVGAVLDLGSGGQAKRAVVTWESSNNTAAMTCVCRASDYPHNTDTAGTYDDAFSFALNSAASGTTAGTFATARRYVKFYLYDPAFAGATGADYFWKITAVSVFADTAYEAANVSTLKATQIIPDALTRATVLLSDDTSGIDPAATVTFAFPEFALDGARTPREAWQAANAAHDYDSRIDVHRRAVFAPKSSAPEVEIGEWHGSTFEDASANSGDDIYNAVKVEGVAANGEKLSVERSASQQAGVVGEPVTSPAPDNPSFATNTTSWTPSSGTAITRDTGVFDTTPASGRWDRGAGALAAGDTLTETFTGTFRAGVTYTLSLALRCNNIVYATGARFGTATDNAYARLYGTSTAFTTHTVAWTPAVDAAAVTLTLTAGFGSSVAYVDSLALTVAKPTLVDRRGFKRSHVLPVRCSLTTELATQIADVWLAAHRTTPLKGTVRITGNGAAREITTGRSVAPEQLLLRTNQLLRLADRVDPDTGGQGRDGRIAEVTYDRATDTATVALDSRRTSHEALLERLAVVIGTG